MASDGPMEIGSILQSLSINRNPSPSHDINPSTSASVKHPVQFSSHADPNASDVDEDEVPLSALQPIPRKKNMPPLPDLRFEQSYLKSIEKAKDWKEVVWITFRDQVVMCLAQGIMWTLILSGWRHMNRASKFSGRSVGSKIRRWWWGVNNWKIPNETVSERLRNGKLAGKVSEYYKDQFSGATLD